MKTKATTLKMIFSVTNYLDLHNAISFWITDAILLPSTVVNECAIIFKQPI